MNASANTQDRSYLHVIILILAVCVAYAKVFSAGFMSWDDIDYIFNSPDIRTISGETFKNWWTEYYIGNYQPLPVFTYAIDFLIGGEDPFMFHFQNIVWHIGDTILVYALLKRLQSNVWLALFVALLFALHPVQTESVSWIAARNKVMNGFFFFLAMYIYADYVKEQKAQKLIWIYVCAVAAYLCKLTAVTLPFALLAVDIWMLRSLKERKVWLEKIPLILLAIPIGVITLQAQEEVDFLNLHPDFTFLHTIVFAGYAYVQYLINLFFPFKLSVLYPYPKEIGAIHVLYTIIAVAIVIGGFIAYKRKQFVLAGGILFYTVNIAIVLQFVQFGEVLMADRYWYVACIGVWYVVVHYIFKLIKQRQTAQIVAGVLCLLYAAGTFIRNDIWLSELNFWKSVTDSFPESSIAQSSLGGIYMEEGNMQEAKVHIDEALKIDDNNAKAWYNKGVISLREGDTKTALTALNRSIAINETTKALFTRALVYQQSGDCGNAIQDVRTVLQDEPKNARAHFIVGDCIDQAGQLQQAVNEYNLAIQYESNEPMYYLRRGLVYAKLGDADKAISDLDKAIRLRPQYADAFYWRGMVKYRRGNDPCKDLQKAKQYGLKEAEQALLSICQ